MGLNVTNYVLQMKGDKSIASGFDHATRTGDNTFSIYFIDGSKVDLTIPLPKDGKDAVDITDVKDLGNGKFTLVLSDGSETSAVQTIKGEKGDKGDKLTFNDLSDEEKASLKGDSGFSPTITENADNTDKIYKLDITTADSTFTTPNLRGADGQGGTGGSGEENKIDSISVNGVNVQVDENKNVDITVPSIDGLAKTEDIPTKVSELTNDSGYLTEHQDISGKVDKVEGKSLISDTEIARLASVDNYNDAQIKTQIQAVANGLMDSVGYSSDYKSIDIIAKNGVKKSVNVAPIISHASITELSDVDTTNKATGKALVYNATTSKHEYADVSGTDEKVKMDSSTDAKYLGELLDNITIANENGELKVKKLDGQEVTITEINYLKGLTMNVMDLVNMFSNGGVKIINTPVATYAELLTLDKSSFIEGISYLVYVLADENHDNAKTTYLVDKDSETPTYFGFADSQRDFTTNPIDLATEITGKLGIANMDSDAIKALFTVDDTYKTETATNNAFSTHGAKALYDELVANIGNKADSTNLTTHTGDTDIHTSTTEKATWNTVTSKASKSDLTSHTSNTNIHITTAERTKWNKVDNKVDKTDIVDNLTSTDTDKPLSANQGKVLKGEVDKKANAIDLTTHTSDTVKHITSAERTLWNTVSNKADASQIHTHSNKTVLDKITEANVKTMNDVASGIGGRNLFTGTSVEKRININTPTNYTTFDLYTTFNKRTLSDLGYSVGDELTLSFEWEISKNGSLSEVYGSFKLEWTGFNSDGSQYGLYLGDIGSVYTLSSSNKKGKVSLTTKITSNDMLKACAIRIRVDNSVVNFKVSKMKLEKGNIATDWTPAPEDMPTNFVTTINSTSTNSQVPSAKSVYDLAGNENRRGYVFNNPTYRGDTWNRVFRVNSLLSCDSGFLTVTVYSNGLCQIATFLMSKNFNRLNIKQINCGGYNGDKGQTRPIKVRIVSSETSIYSFLEIYVSGTSNTNVVATYMPLFCDSVVVLNEKGSIPSGMFACEMTATHDTYENATYTSVLK